MSSGYQLNFICLKGMDDFRDYMKIPSSKMKVIKWNSDNDLDMKDFMKKCYNPVIYVEDEATVTTSCREILISCMQNLRIGVFNQVPGYFLISIRVKEREYSEQELLEMQEFINSFGESNLYAVIEDGFLDIRFWNTTFNYSEISLLLLCLRWELYKNKDLLAPPDNFLTKKITNIYLNLSKYFLEKKEVSLSLFCYLLVKNRGSLPEILGITGPQELVRTYYPVKIAVDYIKNIAKDYKVEYGANGQILEDTLKYARKLVEMESK